MLGTTWFLAARPPPRSTVDLWSISTKERTVGGEVVTPGMPYNHVNDLER